MLDRVLKKDIKDYRAKDVMTKKVITLPPSETLLKAQSLMSQYRIKKIVVVEDEHVIPLGIITLNDIIKIAISDQSDREMYEISISEAMSKRLVTAGESSTVIKCAQIMTRENVSSVVIVEEKEEGEAGQHPSQQSKLSGIITYTDLTDFFAEKCSGAASVSQYMSFPVVTISISDKVSTAAELLLKNNISHLIVTGEGKILGILSERDLLLLTLAFKSKRLRAVYENNLILFHSSKKRNLVEPAFATIRDVFTPDPTIIERNADLAIAAKVMIKQGISAIPVVDSLQEENEKAQLVGIITKTDIVKALAQLVLKAKL